MTKTTFEFENRLHAAQQTLGGQPAAAARLFDALLIEQPMSVAARVGRARCAMLAGQPALAIEHLQLAASVAPDNAAVARSLGVALMAVGALDGAAAQLQRALRLQPQDPLNQLHLGQVLERQGRLLAAAQTYYRALLSAQARGLWLHETSTPPHLQAAVLRAMDLVDRERRRTLEGVLQPLVDSHGAAPLQRVKRCLEGHLKTLSLLPADALQRPRFLYFPDLPAPRYFERAQFAFADQLQAGFSALREEALAVDDALTPFLQVDSAEQLARFLGGERTPAWDAFFFYRDGNRYAENHQRCPRSAALLEALPLVRIREHAPEICFSVLAPGTHILPHTGVSNLRVVAHLPLVIPSDCALEVGGQMHAWREGELVVFDDTYEHHAWNRSPQRRIILLMDTWNPYLSPIERDALAALVAGIGDFNRGEM